MFGYGYASYLIIVMPQKTEGGWGETNGGVGGITYGGGGGINCMSHAACVTDLAREDARS